MYGLAHVAPFSGWIGKIQTYIDPVWSTVADILRLTERIPHISLITILATLLFILSCALFIKAWVWSQQIRYRLTPEYLIVMHGFLTRTQKQLFIVTIIEMTLKRSFLDRLVGVGTIDIDTSDPSFEHVSVQGISSPTNVLDTFYRVWQDAITQSSSTTPDEE